MAKVGRPRKNGVKPPSELSRVIVGLCGYDKARRAGEKYEASLDAGVEEVKRHYPKSKMSRTEMKRILAKYRPRTGLLASLLVGEGDNFLLTEGRMTASVWEARIGPRPVYPQSNAVQR